MRYHIRKKSAIKIGVAVLALIFILPFLISKLEGSSSESEALMKRMRKRKVLYIVHVTHEIRNPH